MKTRDAGLLFLPLLLSAVFTVSGAETAPRVPRFSIEYMDPAVTPSKDFYLYADGSWLKNNPVPPDKSRWASFSELAERNWFLIHEILDEAAADPSASAKTPRRQVGDFFKAAMATNHIEAIGLEPIAADLRRIDAIASSKDVFDVLAYLHDTGIGGLFIAGVSADAKSSSIYALDLDQGGLSLPDREYYLSDSFAAQREGYREHVKKMFMLLGDSAQDAATNAATVLNLESALAKASRARVELRDPDKNYNKLSSSDLIARYPATPWKAYFQASGLKVVGADASPSTAGAQDSEVPVPYEIVGQPEFFGQVDQLLRDQPLSAWKTYLRWHLVHGSAPYLPRAFEEENFSFFGKQLTGQEEQEPRWKRAAQVIDGSIGETLGKLYVERHFPPEAKARMEALVTNLKAAFKEHLEKLDWMTESTRAKALAKFDRFTQKIGYPKKFRDYSSVDIRPDDYYGNVRRAAAFESHRERVRIGQAVDRAEWHMTPITVNAYFNPLENEIVFPAGILQPPFFDLQVDDAVNYGGIGTVIGHEITHGYDDQGRKFDAEGNLKDWWTPADIKAFEERAEKVVREYNAFEPLPGLHVNGKLTLGENIADFGGVTIAYDALQRVLATDPAKRQKIDGFTPEQRFFISYAQVWRTNIRETEQRRRITVDPHSPGRFRVIGPLVNLPVFYRAFEIPDGATMWRPPEERAKIW